jgi:mono/diheme cytochrome c family protein
LSAAAQHGREIFLNQVQPACGVCHALKDAGSQGAVGPNLDQPHPSLANVKQVITQGVGIMPAYGGQLNSQEIDALAGYVFEASR